MVKAAVQYRHADGKRLPPVHPLRRGDDVFGRAPPNVHNQDPVAEGRQGRQHPAGDVGRLRITRNEVNDDAALHLRRTHEDFPVLCRAERRRTDRCYLGHCVLL